MAEYEVWADYEDMTHDGVTVSKARRMLTTVGDMDEAELAITGLVLAEVQGAEMAAAIGHPRHAASFSVWQVETTRTQVLPIPDTPVAGQTSSTAVDR